MNPDTLKGIALLRAMDDAALARLAAVLEPRTLVAGQAVFQEGDPGDGMYFIVSGAVRIEKRTGASAGDQLESLGVDAPDREGRRGVAMKTAELAGDVEVDDVAFDQSLVG